MDLPNIESRLLDHNQRAEEIVNRATAEGRDMTDEEGNELDRILAESKKLTFDRDRILGLTEFSNQLSSALGRKTEPDVAAEPQNGLTATPARKAFATARDPSQKSNFGFPTFGQFAKSVMLASTPGRQNIDPRLIANAPTDFMREGVGEDGGFAVPPDYRSTIMSKITGEASLLSRTDRQQSSSNVWSQPVDVSTPWQTTGGVRAYWTAEGAQKTQSSPSLQNLNLRLHKLAALIPVTDELRDDAPAIDNYLMSRVPIAFDYEINNAIIAGTGVGQPLGILNSGALVTVAAEAGQAADTIHANNILKMWGRLYAGFRNDAVWLVNQDVEAKLPYLAAAATMPDGTTVVGPTATYWGPGDLRNSNNFGLLLNRPVIATEACSALGDVGDIILASFNQYLTVTKVAGLRSDISIHLWFDYDVTAFRFVFRLAGGPWLQTPIARKGSNTNTLSAFVTLAAR